jgi:hypothetical protein
LSRDAGGTVTLTQNEESFIKELEQLSRKYKIVVSGCGCCGSPYLYPLKLEASHDDAGYAYEDQLMWISKNDVYEWDTLSGSIVK